MKISNKQRKLLLFGREIQNLGGKNYRNYSNSTYDPISCRKFNFRDLHESNLCKPES